MEEKNLENLKNETLGNLITERQFLDVICRDYTSVHYADLKNDIGEPLKIALSANAGRIDRVQVRKKIGYTDTIKSYCENFVAGDNKKEFLRVMDKKFLMQQLEKADRFVYRYESIPNLAGHRYFEVQVVRVTEDRFDGKVIVAFRHIDDIVTKEQQYRWELEKMAYTDALTGIGNRAAFTRDMAAYGEEQYAACVVADVNNLKVGNDRYGHEEGDRMIRDAAACLQREFRDIGVCYRIGGDEFCILIREGNREQISQRLQHLGQLAAEENKGRKMSLSIACGYAVRENTRETMERIMGVDRKYNPQECYEFWNSRIKEDHLDYVNENVGRMIEADVVVQLQYPWIHPVYSEVMVRCSGRRIEDSDGMITLEGYHRIISDIEER